MWCNVLPVVLALLLVASVNGEHKHFFLDVDHAFLSPDGVETMVVVANRTFPGPPIRATKGDTITVTIRNGLDNEGLTVHWHGLYMRGTPYADGVAYGTQCPMLDKQTSSYTFQADQVGTYFWHAHSKSLRAEGMMGALIIDDPSKDLQYDGEHTVLLSDWWNRKTTRELAAGLLQQQFKWVGDPQSILLNGVGCYDAATNNPNATTLRAAVDLGVCGAPTVFSVEAGKTYRLRVINSAAMSYLSFTVEGHTLTVVEIDGHYVEPYNVTSLEINTGARYSVLLTANMPVANYWAHAQVRWRAQRHGQAIVRYVGAADALPTTALPTSEATTNPETFPYTDTNHVEAARLFTAKDNLIKASTAEVAASPCPKTTTKQIIVVGTQERTLHDGSQSFTPYCFPGAAECQAPAGGYWDESSNVESQYAGSFGWYDSVTIPGHDRATEGYLKWPVYMSFDSDNMPAASAGRAMELPETPLVLAQYYSLYDEPGETQPPNLVPINSGDVVTVILQNARALNGKMEQHPWHLHGHAFWVLGHGVGIWNASCHSLLNTDNPPLQDVVTLYPASWVAIRFVADNPGVHGMHCHIDWHLEMGMLLYFIESAASIPAPPTDFPLCGKITSALVAKRKALDAPHATYEDVKALLAQLPVAEKTKFDADYKAATSCTFTTTGTADSHDASTSDSTKISMVAVATLVTALLLVLS